jgi:hypothetical protein
MYHVDMKLFKRKVSNYIYRMQRIKLNAEKTVTTEIHHRYFVLLEYNALKHKKKRTWMNKSHSSASEQWVNGDT